MTENEAIKSLEYVKHIIGLPEQGGKWSTNRETIAIDIAIKALEEIQKYRTMEQRLRKLYGTCDGLMKKMVEHLERHEGVDLPEPVFKERLLTDGEIDKWEVYKAIGTVEECREARERQMAKKVKNRELLRDFYNRPYSIRGDCPNCGIVGLLSTNTDYCNACGQKLGWSDVL